MKLHPFARTCLVVVAVTASITTLRFKLWKHVLPGADAVVEASDDGARASLTVGFLPVTCHLTCPVTDYASKTSTTTHFVAKRFSDFPTVAESMKAGKLDATFMIAPLAIKLREQGVPAKIVYLGHRDGSTVIVRSGLAATSLADLRGRTFAIPSKYSNQYLVIRKLMADQGLAADALHFVEMPPPEMPSAVAAGSIDAYFVGEPHAAKAELDGSGRVLYHAKDIWPNFISCVLVVTEKLIAERPAAVADLVRGIAESGEWIEGHRGAAAEVGAPYFRQSEELIRFVLSKPPDRVRYTNLVPVLAEFERMQTIGREVGILEGNVDMKELVDVRFIPPSTK